jgi:hypothetical protein
LQCFSSRFYERIGFNLRLLASQSDGQDDTVRWDDNGQWDEGYPQLENERNETANFLFVDALKLDPLVDVQGKKTQQTK